MARPIGVTIVAALFMAQALFTLAWAVKYGKSVPPGLIAAALAAAGLEGLTAVGLARMRSWGRSLALGLCAVTIAVGLWIRAAGAPPASVMPMLLSAGAVFVYLVSSPARLHFR